MKKDIGRVKRIFSNEEKIEKLILVYLTSQMELLLENYSNNKANSITPKTNKE